MAVDRLINSKEKDSARLICEACGEEFFCGASVGKCWCFAVNVEARALSEIKDKFDNCLCAACLEEWANRSMK